MHRSTRRQKPETAAREAGREAHDSAFESVSGAAHRLEDDVRELHAVEREGKSAATPYIAVAGLWLFLFPIFLLMLACALAAYYWL
jgi:hypothetical protein